jgi:hypothetical protein
VNVEIGTDAKQFPDKEYINGIFVAVHCLGYLNIVTLDGASGWHACLPPGRFQVQFPVTGTRGRGGIFAELQRRRSEMSLVH